MQDIAPRGQRGLVGGEQDRATALVTFVDGVEQDVGGVGSVGQVADLVDDQSVRLQVVSELLLQSAMPVGHGQTPDEHRGDDEARGEAVDVAVGDGE